MIPDLLGEDLCLLGILDYKAECEGCTRPTGPGLVGMTDEIQHPKVLPVCIVCLYSLSEELWRAVILPRAVDIVVRLVKPGQDPAELAEEVREAWGLLRNLLPEQPDSLAS